MDRWAKMKGRGRTLVPPALLTHQYTQFPTAWASILLKSELGLDTLRNDAGSVLPVFTKFPHAIDATHPMLMSKAILHEIKEVDMNRRVPQAA
jgi:hypothetical protein